MNLFQTTISADVLSKYTEEDFSHAFIIPVSEVKTVEGVLNTMNWNFQNIDFSIISNELIIPTTHKLSRFSYDFNSINFREQKEELKRIENCINYLLSNPVLQGE